jgi:hypothetical protein
MESRIISRVSWHTGLKRSHYKAPDAFAKPDTLLGKWYGNKIVTRPRVLTR